MSEGLTKVLAFPADAGDTGVASVGDVAVFSGCGRAEGEKSRRFSGFVLSLVADGAKLAELTCLVAPALCEYWLALSVTDTFRAGAPVSTCSGGPGDRGAGGTGWAADENALRSSPRSKEFVRCSCDACAEPGIGVVKLRLCDEVAIGGGRSSTADETPFSSSSS